MPYGADHGHVDKETNSQPSGKTGGKTSIHMGPAVGNTKTNASMKGVFREPKGKGGTPGPGLGKGEL